MVVANLIYVTNETMNTRHDFINALLSCNAFVCNFDIEILESCQSLHLIIQHFCFLLLFVVIRKDKNNCTSSLVVEDQSCLEEVAAFASGLFSRGPTFNDGVNKLWERVALLP